jgi:hypothetical protein
VQSAQPAKKSRFQVSEIEKMIAGMATRPRVFSADKGIVDAPKHVAAADNPLLFMPRTDS